MYRGSGTLREPSFSGCGFSSLPLPCGHLSTQTRMHLIVCVSVPALSCLKHVQCRSRLPIARSLREVLMYVLRLRLLLASELPSFLSCLVEDTCPRPCGSMPSAQIASNCVVLHRSPPTDATHPVVRSSKTSFAMSCTCPRREAPFQRVCLGMK